MNQMTRTQLNKLKPKDWIWIERPQYTEGDKGSYYQIIATCSDGIVVRVGTNNMAFMYSDMGELWIAYKNKEIAEAKSQIMDLSCLTEYKPRHDKNVEVIKSFQCGNGWPKGIEMTSQK